jgi:hypothetical protein
VGYHNSAPMLERARRDLGTDRLEDHIELHQADLNGHMNRFFIDLYYEYKRQHGCSDLEIARKREALENRLSVRQDGRWGLIPRACHSNSA